MVQDLVSDDSDHLKGLSRSDRIHKHVSVDSDEVLGVQLAVIVLQHQIHLVRTLSRRPNANALGLSQRGSHLAGGINNLRCKLLPLVLDHLAERVFDGRIIAFDKVPLDELDGERRFACSRVNCWTLMCTPLRRGDGGP